jgi:membrane protease YdiL (CAAX protease family)
MRRLAGGGGDDWYMTAEPSTRPAAPVRGLAVTVVLMAAVAVAARFGPAHTMLVIGPLGAVLLLLLARSAGLNADDVGLGRRYVRRGLAYAALSATAVLAVYVLAVLYPATRQAFLDERYRTGVGTAVLTAVVVVPLGTVLFEEVAFRGVLWGLVRRRSGPILATLASSGLFGLWHVLPSLRLNRVNPAVADLVGPGRAGQVAAVAGAVVFTALAGGLLCELRRRSGSLLAPAGLHAAVNGFGVLVAATTAT